MEVDYLCVPLISSGMSLLLCVTNCFHIRYIIFSLSELVRHEENGFVFENAEELSEQLLSWFAHYPNNISLVNIKETFQKNLRDFQSIRWNENWNKHALPHFQ